MTATTELLRAAGPPRLRDRIDELLFGYQDFGIVGRRPEHPQTLLTILTTLTFLTS
ncbi:MAG TPA: hypothetical protein VF756_25210 [Thermoanaerobaculia bacterium]